MKNSIWHERSRIITKSERRSRKLESIAGALYVFAVFYILAVIYYPWGSMLTKYIAFTCAIIPFGLSIFFFIRSVKLLYKISF